MANPIPVFPDVGSTTHMPGFSLPVLSASSIMARAARSLMEWVGLKDSNLTYTSAEPTGTMLFNLTVGVRPTVSRMLL